MSAKNSQFIANLYQWDALMKICHKLATFRTIVSLSISILVVANQRQLSSWFAIRFLFLDLISFIAENVLSHIYVFPNIECIFSAKSFSLGNLSLLTNFQNIS